MMLGDVLSAARRSGADIETWLKPADPDLWTALHAEAMRRQEDTATFARGAVADFSNRAGEEDWAMLVSRMRDADDPGRALLLTMMRWRLDISRKENAGANEEVTL
ncbi:hypothetical protein [uncultured Jannaschia sp.]|uniref:hypothetical protein n=1 Tax=uncultured Jannaschia sp. TaxID=293347 RepID=UPI002626296A|nr:hypothetical protein [uncultured Jannaschia sp.]